MRPAVPCPLLLLNWPGFMPCVKSPSEFISVSTVREGRPASTCRLRNHVSKPRPLSFLLTPVFGPVPVPVCLHCLVVPDGGRLCVAEVAGLSCVVCGEEQERLHGKRSQLPPLKMLLVLISEERRKWVCLKMMSEAVSLHCRLIQS